MKVLLLFSIMFCSLGGCSPKQQKEAADDSGWMPRLSDSFSLKGYTASVRELENRKSDSFLVICAWQGRELLRFLHETPSASIRAQNLYGSAAKELVVDDCVACEGFRSLRIFSFDEARERFVAVKGLDSISSDISRLPGTDLYFDRYAHNRGGEESTLFRLAGDSCIILGKMNKSYSYDSIEIVLNERGGKLVRVPHSERVDGDSGFAYLWRKALAGSSRP